MLIVWASVLAARPPLGRFCKDKAPPEVWSWLAEEPTNPLRMVSSGQSKMLYLPTELEAAMMLPSYSCARAETRPAPFSFADGAYAPCSKAAGCQMFTESARVPAARLRSWRSNRIVTWSDAPRLTELLEFRVSSASEGQNTTLEPMDSPAASPPWTPASVVIPQGGSSVKLGCAWSLTSLASQMSRLPKVPATRRPPTFTKAMTLPEDGKDIGATIGVLGDGFGHT
mmetsp:Transcript_66641/g.159034  ORF Transcript_66641/g.159034 Transcript_66641/m.159034 type:complete len:227 (-) Transcript_66641:549-1229(-)